jgi:hypothetical protein
MNLIELQRALGQLRLGGMAAVLETRLRQAQAEAMAPIDLISCLISDELTRRSDRLLERRRKQASFRDPNATLDNFDFSFNPKMNRSLVFDLATSTFITRREDALFLGPSDPATFCTSLLHYGHQKEFIRRFQADGPASLDFNLQYLPQFQQTSAWMVRLQPSGSVGGVSRGRLLARHPQTRSPL